MIKTAEEKQRVEALLRGIGKILLLGFAYFIFVTVTHLYIPCVFNLITGLKCPGCGIAHCLMSLIHLHPAEAWHYNQLVCVLLPLSLPFAIYRAVQYVRYNRTGFYVWEAVLLFLVFLGTVAFGIGRNIL